MRGRKKLEDVDFSPIPESIAAQKAMEEKQRQSMSKESDRVSGLTCLPLETTDQIIRTTDLNFSKTNKELMEIEKNYHQIKTLDQDTLEEKIMLFRKNSDEWKEFEKHGLKLDLRGANMTGAELQGVDLRGANMVNSQWWLADLRGADLRGAVMVKAKLVRAKLQGADLRGANLEGVDLSGADLRGVKLQDADLTGSLLSGVNLSNANCTSTNFENARTERFYDHDYRGVAYFTPLKAHNTKFIGANFKRFGRDREGSYVGPEFNSADFRGANLCGASFNNAMFRPVKTGEPGVIFDHHTKFKCSNKDHYSWFIGAIFENVDFSGLDISQLTMGSTHNCSTQFVNCNLNRTIFAGCNLYQTLFSKCSMVEVNMKHIVGEHSEYFFCDLSLAKFNHAHLRNASFSKNNLTQADFRDSKHVEIRLQDDNVLTGIKVNDGTTKAAFRKLIQRRVEYNLNARNLRMINQLSRLSDDIRKLPSDTLGSEIVPLISDKYRQDRRTKEWKPKGKKLRFRSRKRKSRKRKSRKRKSN